jgi:hypothetical protein
MDEIALTFNEKNGRTARRLKRNIEIQETIYVTLVKKDWTFPGHFRIFQTEPDCFSPLQNLFTPCFQQNQHVTLWHDRCILSKQRQDEKEDSKMKINKSKQGAYAGAGAGLVLFGLFGLLPGSLIGGAMGISVAGMLFGLPLEPGLLSRMIVLGSMLLGVMVSGIMIVTASSSIGWLVGNVMSTTVHNSLAAAERR